MTINEYDTTMQSSQPAHKSLPPLWSQASQVHLQSCDIYKILNQMLAKVTLCLCKVLFYSALGCTVPRLSPCLDSISCKQTEEAASTLPQAMQRPSLQQSEDSGALWGKAGPGTGYIYQHGWQLSGQGNAYLGSGGYWSTHPLWSAPEKQRQRAVWWCWAGWMVT